MPRTPGSVAEVLGDLSKALRDLRIPWYVFGAQALVLRGFPRATADLDVTVLLGATPTSRLVTALGRRGFKPGFGDAAFIAATRVLPIVHKSTGFPVDIVLGGPGLEELFASASEKLRVGRLLVPVATATHLVVMKVLAGRPMAPAFPRKRSGVWHATAGCLRRQSTESVRPSPLAGARVRFLRQSGGH